MSYIHTVLAVCSRHKSHAWPGSRAWPGSHAWPMSHAWSMVMHAFRVRVPYDWENNKSRPYQQYHLVSCVVSPWPSTPKQIVYCKIILLALLITPKEPAISLTHEEFFGSSKFGKAGFWRECICTGRPLKDRQSIPNFRHYRLQTRITVACCSTRRDASEQS